jgi:hypothetical protein
MRSPNIFMENQKTFDTGRAFRVLQAVFLFLLLILAMPAVTFAKSTPSPCRIHHPSDDRIESECRRLKKGETLESLFGERWIDVARFNRIDRRHIFPGMTIKIPKNLDEIRDFTPMPKEYEPARQDPKFILVDLAEQFLGAYEYGRLVFSVPVATGGKDNPTPTGEYLISAVHSDHVSSLYYIEDTDKLYPMNYALRFFVNGDGVAFWMHGRDVPGYPASHGCIGLYDEEMQKKYYGFPRKPVLEDAKRLFEWVAGAQEDDDKFHVVKDGPKVLITGKAPLPARRKK